MENHTESMKPALKRAYPVMLQRMSKPGGGRGRTRAQSPQPSVSSPAGHGSGGTSPSAKKRFVGSPAPLLADPLPRAQPPVITPDHEAFASIHLGFKTAEMKLSLYYNDVVLRFSASPSAEGLELKRGEFDKLIEAIEAIDHHMSSQDGERRQAVGAFKVKKEQQHGLPDCKAISWGNVRRYQGLLVPEWPWWWPGPYYARGHSPQGRMEDDQEAFIRRGGTLAWCRNVSGEEQYHRKPGGFSISDFRLIRLELGSSPRIPRTIMTIGLSHDIFLYFLYVQLSFPIEAVELTIFGGLVDTGCTFIWNISCMCSAHMRPVSGFSSIGDDEI